MSCCWAAPGWYYRLFLLELTIYYFAPGMYVTYVGLIILTPLAELGLMLSLEACLVTLRLDPVRSACPLF